MKAEDFLSSIDSADPLGSTKPANLRGDFPDIREDSTAGEDLSIQPPIDSILQYPNKFAWPDPDEEISKKIKAAEEEAQRSLDELMDSVTEISVMHSGAVSNSSDSLNITEIELPNPTPIPRNFANLREKDRLPENTHCDKERRDGNKCCDGRLASTMRDAMRHMATSPDFGVGKEGVIAAELQQKVQQRFKKSYEVIVSRSDFVISSYNGGDTFCKFDNKGFYILAYSSPKQYDIDEKEDEKKLASTSNKEPLGSDETMFNNETPWHIALRLETSGERAGYPVGSHCSEARTGSKCCSLILFNAMKSGYDLHVSTSNFDPYDIRNISKAVQWNVEEVLQHSAEVIVSLDDFAYATYNNNSYICKYRVDQYYMLAYTTPNHDLDDYDEMATAKIENEPEAQIVYPSVDRTANRIPFQNTPSPYWTTPVPIPTQVFQPLQYTQQPMFNQQPVFNQQQMFNQQPMYLQPSFNQPPLPYQYPAQQSQFNPFLANSFHRSKRQIGASPYPIHQNVYNDIGSAKPFNCPADLSGLAGMACCDGGLQFEANKVIDQAKQAPDFDKHNTRNLAKLMTRAVQKRFGTTFESIVAEADFSWGTNKFNGRTCKIDNDGYTALTYQSSSKPPPPSDFLDIPNDPTLGGPTGSSGGGGGAGGTGSEASAASAADAGGAGDGGGAAANAGGGGNGGAGTGNGGGAGNAAAAGNGNGAAAGNGNGAAAGNGNGVGAGDASAAAAAAQAQAAAAAQAQAAAAFAAQAQAAAAAEAARNAALAAAAAANSNDPFSALVAAAGGACFSVDTWVTTEFGKKRMDELEIGDLVLTAALNHTYFTPVTLWIHREPEKVQEFLTIMTEYGKTLRLTARHFMYRNKCGSTYQQYIKVMPHNGLAVFAEDLEVGDCVIVMYKGKFRQQKSRA
uniref:HintN domain-containing protein n=1 Tax=Caenorhabditis tropicalis TaxID=1561998 RepID=A0A1I7T5R0_9PELO